MFSKRGWINFCLIVGPLFFFSGQPPVFGDEPQPVIYDDFSDGKLQNRTGSDPWGRKLPEWTLTKVWNASTGEAQTEGGTISLPCKVITGTWKFRYRYLVNPPSNGYNWGTTCVFIKKANGSTVDINNPTDGHWWMHFWASGDNIDPGWPRVAHSYPYINMVGSCISSSRVAGTAWHEVVFIRDDRGYVGTWLDGTFVEYSRDRSLDITENTEFNLGGYNLAGYTGAFDNVEVYDGVFLLPGGAVAYSSSTARITINAYHVDLQKIAEAVNDPQVFSYTTADRTAVCRVDLLIKSGAELEISSGTLKMAGGKKIMYEREAMIFLDNASIVSADANPWYWQLSGASAYAAVVLSIVDSQLDNFGGFSATGMKCLYWKDSQFTNLVGEKPFNISLRRPPNGEYLISGCLFTGKTGSEMVYLQGGDQFHQLKPEPLGLDIVDTEFRQVKLFHQYDWPYYLSPGRPRGTENLINSKITSLEYSGSFYRFKYYLDVKVVDKDGRAVSGAKVTVANENDNVNYPSENLRRGWKYLKVGDQVSAFGEDYFDGQQGNWFKGLVDVNNYSSTLTGSDGHTPLPSDIAHTLVITDKNNWEKKVGDQWEYGTSMHTYTVTAEKDGVTGELKGIDPDESWYRENPALANKSVVVVLGGDSYIGDDVSAPLISVTTPAEGEKVQASLVPIDVSVIDNSGISKVEFYLDDKLLQTFTAGPYKYFWATQGYSLGEHRIKVVAEDGKGNRGEKTLSVELIAGNQEFLPEDKKTIFAYPNPYIGGKTGNNKVVFGNLAGESVIKIYRVSGELIETIETEKIDLNGQAEWDVSKINSGVYLYVVSSPQGLKKGRISIIK